MPSIKQRIKQILIKKQHKNYDRELKCKDIDYDTWIREQESRLKSSAIIVEKDCESGGKCQKNDFKIPLNGGTKTDNDGNQSEYNRNSRFFEVTGIKTDDQTSLHQPGVSISMLETNIEALFANPDSILTERKPDVILITLYDGKINVNTIYTVAEKFVENENIILIYGDEDISSSGRRQAPWFKPDWSPDTFLSGFYFGGLVAIRTKYLLNSDFCHRCSEIKQQASKRDAQKSCPDEQYKSHAIEYLYQFIYKLLREQHAFEPKTNAVQLPVCHIPQVLFHSCCNGYELLKTVKLSDAGSILQPQQIDVQTAEQASAEQTPLLSIIIPSKDNPEILFKCLDSIFTVTKTAYSYEILVVDNGSNEENRNLISGRANQIRYLYVPMQFNFSAMCNLGAEKAEGEYLLFLNDDMEVIQSTWLDLMMEKAQLPYAGAVGAKLLYPDSDIIQHAGITNLRVGPAHKLQFLHDDEEHYYGRNRGVYDVLAVTGACLMVNKTKFNRVGGFFEGLAVAFNDVDICYSLFEEGYYNIIRNDVRLYHHESLSRGKDGESEEKQQRLQKEKDVLYVRHQEIYGQDPFYHPYLTTDMLESEYSPAFHYQVTLDMPWSKAHIYTEEVAKAREDQCLVVGMECAMDIYKWKYGVAPKEGKQKLRSEDNGYYFQGYTFIIGSDNACYKKTLLLRKRDNNSILAVPVDIRFRPDIKKNLREQLNVDLTGFAAKLCRNQLQEGIYQFGMLAEDQCSRQKLVNWSNWILEVGPDEE